MRGLSAGLTGGTARPIQTASRPTRLRLLFRDFQNILVFPFPERLRFTRGRSASVPAAGGCNRVLAGSLECENLSSYRLRKIDEGELGRVEKVILSALVNDPHEIVFARSRIRYNSIDLSKDQ